MTLLMDSIYVGYPNMCVDQFMVVSIYQGHNRDLMGLLLDT